MPRWAVFMWRVWNTTCFHVDMPEVPDGQGPPGRRGLVHLPCAGLCVARVERRACQLQSPVTPPGIFLHCLFLCVCLYALPGVRVCVRDCERARNACGKLARVDAAAEGWEPCPSFGHTSTEVLPAARPAVGLSHFSRPPGLWFPYSQCPEDWGPISLCVPRSWRITPKHLEMNERAPPMPSLLQFHPDQLSSLVETCA